LSRSDSGAQIISAGPVRSFHLTMWKPLPTDDDLDAATARLTVDR
jgi:hypothetical protein